MNLKKKIFNILTNYKYKFYFKLKNIFFFGNLFNGINSLFLK